MWIDWPYLSVLREYLLGVLSHRVDVEYWRVC